MKNRTIIGLVIAFLLFLITMFPGILPLSAETVEKMKELRQLHFFIDGSGKMTIAHILTLIGAISLLWMLFTVIRLILEKTAKNTHSRTIAILLTELFRYLAVIIAVIWGLSILGVNTSALLAGAGIISLIIGFGAQSLIEDIITGLFIIFEGDFQVGDIVTINDCRGVVQEIGVRNTKILDDRGNLKIINNKQISGILNMTARNSICLTDISIEYDEDIPRLERILAAELPRLRRKLPAIRENPRYLGVQSLGDSAIVIRILTECREADRFQLERDMNRELRLIFERHGINIPFPQIVVNRRKEES